MVMGLVLVVLVIIMDLIFSCCMVYWVFVVLVGLDFGVLICSRVGFGLLVVIRFRVLISFVGGIWWRQLWIYISEWMGLCIGSGVQLVNFSSVCELDILL